MECTLETRRSKNLPVRRFRRLEVVLDPSSTEDDVRFLVVGSDQAERYASLISRAAQRYFRICGVPKALPVACVDERDRLRVAYKELVVRFTSKTSSRERERIFAQFGLRALNPSAFTSGREWRVAHTSATGWPLFDIANALMRLPQIVFATPSFLSEYRRSSSPPGGVRRWHLKKIHIEEAWNIVATKSTGKIVVVAVLDDGVDVDHPNLQANIQTNPDPDEPLDVCGRDFTITPDKPGHFDPRPKQFMPDPDDSDYHGTHCAGLVVANAKNRGAVGAAPQCRVLAVKVFNGKTLARDADVASAIRYAYRHADVISCSWTGPEGPCVDDALQGATIKHVPVVCATGDHLTDVGFPASDNRTIAVGASTIDDTHAPYSTSGDRVDIVAPSNDEADSFIFSTDVSGIGKGDDPGGQGDLGLSWDQFGGTSAATPIVASVAALCLAVNPNLTHRDIRSILRQTADPIDQADGDYIDGHSKTLGYGLINAEQAVNTALTWPTS